MEDERKTTYRIEDMPVKERPRERLEALGRKKPDGSGAAGNHPAGGHERRKRCTASPAPAG